MTYYQREKLFWLAALVLVALHVDAWHWYRLQPLLLGFIPYELWYRIILTFVSWGLLWWLRVWVWPVADDIVQERRCTHG